MIALNKAVDISLNNVPKFQGETLVVLDISASMKEELREEIKWLEREKRDAIKAHAKNLQRYNNRIKSLKREINELYDD